MKKYIQACEIGESIYGKNRTTSKKNAPPKGVSKSGNNLISEYSRFYKNQTNVMEKVFKSGK
ncbi:MAG: hypothetical protein P9L90_07440 [Candidatus Aadella gelida]|nr:hypothetical protein [Candidatus Aadella gelida]